MVPYVDGMLHDETAAAVVGLTAEVRFECIDAGDPYAYGWIWRRLWDERRTVICVEQDVAPTRQQMGVILGCGHLWCSYNYDPPVYQPGPMLGLARIDGSVMGAHPYAAVRAMERRSHNLREARWDQVDARLARDLIIRGVPWVEHQPRVRHLHDYSAIRA